MHGADDARTWEKLMFYPWKEKDSLIRMESEIWVGWVSGLPLDTFAVFQERIYPVGRVQC